MVRNKKVVIVMPAYNAAKTLISTYNEIPFDIVDEIILVDDASVDETAKIAEELKLKTIVHSKNLGYGGNQKTCYCEALKANADIIIMLHPDYQYTPKLISAMAYMLDSDEFDVVLGSRILGGKAIQMILYSITSFYRRQFMQISGLAK
jgi:glycosyltransferase involved in cell wall biosynthesis